MALRVELQLRLDARAIDDGSDADLALSRDAVAKRGILLLQARELGLWRRWRRCSAN